MTTELEAELEQLSSALAEKGAELHDVIKEEKHRKEAELQVTTVLYLSLYNLINSDVLSGFAPQMFSKLNPSCPPHEVEEHLKSLMFSLLCCSRSRRRRGGPLCCRVSSCCTSPITR